MRHIRLLTLAALVVIAGCSPPAQVQVADLLRDATLTEQKVETDGLAVGGVTWAPERQADEPSHDWSLALGWELQSHPSFSNLAQAKELRWSLGDQAYDALLSRFAAEGKLEKPDLTLLAQSTNAVRYCLFVRLELNETSTDQESFEQGGTEDEIEYYYATRTVRALFVVYDMMTAGQAWHGRITDSITNSNSVPRRHEGAFFKSLLSGLLEDLLYGTFPDPPPLDPVVSKVFADFAASFPTTPQRNGPAFLGLGTHGVALAQPSPPRSAPAIPLTVLVEVSPTVAGQVYTYESPLTGDAQWLVPVGEEVKRYADAYLLSTFSTGEEVVIAINLISFDVTNGQATCDVCFSVRRGEEVLFERTYHGEGSTHALKLALAGSLVMEEVLRESADGALRSVFQQFLDDARLQYQRWHSIAP